MHNSYIIESITTKYLNLLITFYNLLQNKKEKKKAGASKQENKFGTVD